MTTLQPGKQTLRWEVVIDHAPNAYRLSLNRQNSDGGFSLVENILATDIPYDQANVGGDNPWTGIFEWEVTIPDAPECRDSPCVLQVYDLYYFVSCANVLIAEGNGDTTTQLETTTEGASTTMAATTVEATTTAAETTETATLISGVIFRDAVPDGLEYNSEVDTPLANADIVLRVDGSRVQRYITGEDGRYFFEVTPGVEYVVRAKSIDGLEPSFDLDGDYDRHVKATLFTGDIVEINFGFKSTCVPERIVTCTGNGTQIVTMSCDGDGLPFEEDRTVSECSVTTCAEGLTSVLVHEVNEEEGRCCETTVCAGMCWTCARWPLTMPQTVKKMNAQSLVFATHKEALILPTCHVKVVRQPSPTPSPKAASTSISVTRAIHALYSNR